MFSGVADYTFSDPEFTKITLVVLQIFKNVKYIKNTSVEVVFANVRVNRRFLVDKTPKFVISDTKYL